MAGRISRRTVVLGGAFAAMGIGCGTNPFIIPQLLLNGGKDARVPAEYALKLPPKKSEAKVIVLVWSNSGLHPDLTGVDRMLNAELIQMLDARLKENEEKVLVLKMPRIDEYKSENPNWRSVNPMDIGKTFGGDYVIDVEVQEMDLFKPGSRANSFKAGRQSRSRPSTYPSRRSRIRRSRRISPSSSRRGGRSRSNRAVRCRSSG